MKELHLPVDTLNEDAAGLVPHRPPMLFVKKLLLRKENLAIVLAELPACGVLPELFVELIAQAMAVVSGYDAKKTGEPVKGGMLVGVDRFFCAEETRRVVSGGSYLVKIEKEFQFGSITVIAGEIYVAETAMEKLEKGEEFAPQERVAWGKVKVWEDAA